MCFCGQGIHTGRTDRICGLLGEVPTFHELHFLECFFTKKFTFDDEYTGWPVVFILDVLASYDGMMRCNDGAETQVDSLMNRGRAGWPSFCQYHEKV